MMPAHALRRCSAPRCRLLLRPQPGMGQGLPPARLPRAGARRGVERRPAAPRHPAGLPDPRLAGGLVPGGGHPVALVPGGGLPVLRPGAVPARDGDAMTFARWGLPTFFWSALVLG